MRSRTERTRLRRRLRGITDTVLVVGALAGLLSVVWWALGTFLGFGLVSFATGSMAPAYPAGALAVSRSVPVADVHPGDVVTIDRGGDRLPLTHRVRSADVDGRAVRLVLQGDANAEPDPAPYTVDAVRIVLFPLPVDLLRALAGPAGLALGSVLLSILVVVLLWPDPDADPPADLLLG